jgi:hypothetical protein
MCCVGPNQTGKGKKLWVWFKRHGGPREEAVRILTLKQHLHALLECMPRYFRQ